MQFDFVWLEWLGLSASELQTFFSVINDNIVQDCCEFCDCDLMWRKSNVYKHQRTAPVKPVQYSDDSQPDSAASSGTNGVANHNNDAYVKVLPHSNGNSTYGRNTPVGFSNGLPLHAPHMMSPHDLMMNNHHVDTMRKQQQQQVHTTQPKSYGFEAMTKAEMNGVIDQRWDNVMLGNASQPSTLQRQPSRPAPLPPGTLRSNADSVKNSVPVYDDGSNIPDDIACDPVPEAPPSPEPGNIETYISISSCI